jgi:hypothetical protein
MTWARTAGLTEVTASASVWCFARPEDTLWLAETWGITDSPLAERAVELGVACRDELAVCTEAWHNWPLTPTGGSSSSTARQRCRAPCSPRSSGGSNAYGRGRHRSKHEGWKR